MLAKLLAGVLVVAGIVAAAIAIPVAIHNGDDGDGEPAVVADFSASPTSGDASLSVQFTDQSTGEIMSWDWDFNNDGTVDSTEQNPVHIYSTPGTYTIWLKVSGWEGSDTETKTDYITVNVLEEPLTISPDNITMSPCGDDQLFTASGGIPPYSFELIDAVLGVAELTDYGDGTALVHLDECGFISDSSAVATDTLVDAEDVSVTVDIPSIPIIEAAVIVDNSTASVATLDVQCGGTVLTVRLSDSAGTEEEATVAFTLGVGWVKTYSPTGIDSAKCIQQILDADGNHDGYIVVGSTTSYGAGNTDLWVMRLDKSGVVQWQKTYGTSALNYGYSVRQTFDQQGAPSGYIVAGGSIHSSTEQVGIWIFKLDNNGDVDWQKVYKGSQMWNPASVQQTDDGGYIVAGSIFVSTGGGNEAIVLKLDSSGEIEWQMIYGITGSLYDDARDIYQTTDGGYIMVGRTNRFEVTDNNDDILLVKLNSSGGIVWENTYGASNYNERAFSVQQTDDGGYIVAGEIESMSGGGEGEETLADINVWILKLNSSGGIEWQKTYGGTDEDSASYIMQTIDGDGNHDGYIVVGSTKSYGAGNSDIWILKLDENGIIDLQRTYGGTDTEEGNYVQQTKDGGYIIAGFTLSFGTGSGDAWILKLNAA